MIVGVRSDVADVIAIHSAAGRRFEAGGVRSFVREQGSGPTVVLVHGVPVSSLVYRRVIVALADQGVRAVAFDLPGLGLADRPRDFDYTWTGLARWFGAALDALGLERVHLVVHDVGGAVAGEWAVANPHRVQSLTALNTTLSPASFTPVWPMRPFRVRGLGELWLRGTPPAVFEALFRHIGLGDRRAMSSAEIQAHRPCCCAPTVAAPSCGSCAGSSSTRPSRTLLARLGQRPYPARVVWGDSDPAFDLDEMRAVQRILRVDDAVLLDAKHFLQEDQATSARLRDRRPGRPLG